MFFKTFSIKYYKVNFYRLVFKNRLPTKVYNMSNLNISKFIFIGRL